MENPLLLKPMQNRVNVITLVFVIHLLRKKGSDLFLQEIERVNRMKIKIAINFHKIYDFQVLIWLNVASEMPKSIK